MRVPHLLFPTLLGVLLFSACPQEPEDPVVPAFPECENGFTYEETIAECDCPAPATRFGDDLCFEISDQYWYSDMSGCLIEDGVAFAIGDTLSVRDAGSRVDFLVLSPYYDYYGELQLLSSTRLVRFYGRRDSVQLIFSPDVLRAPIEGDPDLGYGVGFIGEVIDSTTIVGQFVFGTPHVPFDDPVATCPAIFTRGRR